jgi:ABC-type phosphate transport system substrate-binding protein
MRKFHLACIVLTLLLPSLCAARDVAVITDKANPSSGLSTKELVKMLRRETAKWPDGRKAFVYLGEPGSPDGKILRDKTYLMTEAELRAFAGQKEIAILDSDDAVLKAVAENPGSIGIINVYSINSTVKVLKVDGKLPLEQGYLLHGN